MRDPSGRFMRNNWAVSVNAIGKYLAMMASSPPAVRVKVE
jgi:hypothetical protein